MRLIGLLLFLFAAIAGRGWAQLTRQGPEPTFDGQTVVAVDLIANPHRNVDPLRPLVVQKAGAPYSQSAVVASIQGLESTGEFKNVRVGVIPDPNGLRLDFLLEPAYYIGVVEFPTLTKKFSYTRLLQVVDLPDEDPYDKDHLPASEKALSEFLRHNGYFQAAVQTHSEIDDSHRIVNVTFSGELGKQARIGTVSFMGPSAKEDAKLLHSVHSLWARLTGASLKPGKPYSRARITNAISRIRKTLSGQHRLASKVKELPPQYHPDTNQIDVTFNVKVGPTVIVRTTGPRLTWIPFLSTRELKKLIPIYSEGTIDRDLVEEGQQNLINYLQKKGYFDAKVSIDFQRQPDKILLVYHIDKGKKHKVTNIDFRGNTAIAASTLLANVAVKKADFFFWSHGAVSQTLLAQSVTDLENLYHDHGYEQVKISYDTIDRRPNIVVVFKIAEGPETLVENVEVHGNKALSVQQMMAPTGFGLKPGKAYSPRALIDDRNRISANYEDHGYLNAEVTATVERVANQPNRINVIYNIDEHQLVRVGAVVYLGKRHTKLSLLRKTANIHTEAPMRRATLLSAESNLYDLNIFDWASVGPKEPITTQTQSDALVKVHEAKRTEIIYGFGFEVSHRGGNVPAGTVAVPGLPTIQIGKYQIAPSQATFASPRGSIEVVRRNMRGLGETASASILAYQLDQRALLSYVQPHFIGSSWSSLSSLLFERNTENPLFAATLGDASFQVERVLSHKTNTRFQLRYDFNRTVLSHLLVPELVLPRDRNVNLSTISGTLVRDTRDKPLDAHRGSFATLDLGITPTTLGSSASFARIFGQFALYHPLHSIVLANSIRLGLAKAYADSFVPTSQLFFSGGGTTLRGFAVDEAGPLRVVPFCNGVLANTTGCVNINVPIGGRQLFIFNSEVRFPLRILKPLGGVIFYDGGNVYRGINFNDFIDNYTNTVGVGLRYETPIGPIRFDIGKNLNPVPGFNSIQYFITLGQAF